MAILCYVYDVSASRCDSAYIREDEKQIESYEGESKNQSWHC